MAVLVVTGPSGVGKGTLIRHLLERRPDYRLSVSATTRPPRPGEVDGRDYHFLTEQEFERRLAPRGFLEHALYAGNHYGTLKEEVDRSPGNLVLEIEVEGARQVRKALPEAIQVFIAPPSDETLRERLVGRQTDDPEVIERRLARAKEELDARKEFKRVIVNDDLERAVDELVELAATIGSPSTDPPEGAHGGSSPASTSCWNESTRTTRACSSRPSGRARSTRTTTTSARGPSTSTRRRWWTPSRRTTSRSRSRSSPRASSTTATGPNPQGALNGQGPPRRDRWDLGVQGGRAGPAPDEGGSRGAGGADAGEPAVRGARDVRGHNRRAGARRRVRARSRARRLPRRRAARARADLAPRARPAGRRLRRGAGVRPHDREARPRDGGQPAHERGAREHCAARRGPGDERADVAPPGHEGQRPTPARARRHDRAPEQRRAGGEGRVRRGPPGRAGRRPGRDRVRVRVLPAALARGRPRARDGR